MGFLQIEAVELASSRDEVVNTGLLSSCSGKLGVSLKLHQFLSGPLDMHKKEVKPPFEF